MCMPSFNHSVCDHSLKFLSIILIQPELQLENHQEFGPLSVKFWYSHNIHPKHSKHISSVLIAISGIANSNSLDGKIMCKKTVWAKGATRQSKLQPLVIGPYSLTNISCSGTIQMYLNCPSERVATLL
jgi:hypothetical protein